MSRGLVLLLVGLSVGAMGCKERNPAWLGPGDGTTSTAETSTGTVVGSSESSATSSTAGTSTVGTSGSTTTSDTSGSETSSATSDIPCNNDQQCPEELVCGPDVCQRGEEGDPCTARRHCADTAPICSSSGVCQDGSVGDACVEAGDCATPRVNCIGNVCA